MSHSTAVHTAQRVALLRVSRNTKVVNLDPSSQHSSVKGMTRVCNINLDFFSHWTHDNPTARDATTPLPLP